jgi:hypothetical protein
MKGSDLDQSAERERIPLEEPLRVRAETKRTAEEQQKSGCHSHGNSVGVIGIPPQPASTSGELALPGTPP